MNPDLVTIYTAQSLLELRLLADRLIEADIQAFIDNTESPFDGLTTAYQTLPVQVLPKDEPAARKLATEFDSEKTPDIEE